ncbi:MAG: hypothetical protein LBP93_08735 [Treponema sp.]|jgi:hypothetical protein|nr:hypothetical protein [Treponema sp.]
MNRNFLSFLFSPVFVLGLGLAACDTGLISRSYSLEPAPLPPAWEEILGAAHWQVEWINPRGIREIRRIDGTGSLEIEVLPGWANPVMAFPYWPERGIDPGMMRPAGGIFPFDVEGGRIRLSWRGGVAAWFYRELAQAWDGGNRLRGPQYFDWPRFRELLDDPVLGGPILANPWLADWQGIALKTVQSGFDRRRIIPQPTEDLPVPLPHNGPWIGPSPFEEPVPGRTGETVLFPVTGRVDTYICPGGILRCSRGAWLWLPWGEKG